VEILFAKLGGYFFRNQNGENANNSRRPSSPEELLVWCCREQHSLLKLRHQVLILFWLKTTRWRMVYGTMLQGD